MRFIVIEMLLKAMLLDEVLLLHAFFRLTYDVSEVEAIFQTKQRKYSYIKSKGLFWHLQFLVNLIDQQHIQNAWNSLS